MCGTEDLVTKGCPLQHTEFLKLQSLFCFLFSIKSIFLILLFEFLGVSVLQNKISVG